MTTSTVARTAPRPLGVALLGPPRIEVGDAPIDVDTRKAIALLAYLVVTGRQHPRDALAGLLWPTYDPARAKASLRRTLSTLARAVGPDRLLTDRRTIAVVRDGVTFDLELFRQLMATSAEHDHDSPSCPSCLGALERAVAMHRGEFLEGFSLRDSSEFDEWQALEADRARRELSVALERLVHALADANRYDDAIGHAERWLALDELNENAHRSLMRLLAWSGNRAAALRRYRSCVAVLERELGVEPLEETTALYHAIEEDRAPDPPERPRAGAAPHPVRLAYPMVGRDHELGLLLGAHRQVGRAGRLAVVDGEAGIGKTRLVDEFTAKVGAAGARLARSQCYEDEAGLAYGALTDALTAAVEANGGPDGLPVRWRSEISRLVPEFDDAAVEPEPLTRPGAQARFYQAVAHVFDACLGGEPAGVLVVEDLQWADDATLDLLGYLVRRLDRLHLLLVLTWRSDAAADDARLRRLARRGGDAITLDRLDRAAVAELVKALDVRNRPPDLADRLHRESEGLPLFLAEYIAQLDDADDTGSWTIPSGVRGVLLRRLEALSGAARQVLTTAAVVGRSFDPDTVVRASGRTEDETVAALDELLAAGLIDEVETAATRRTYDFTHERIREVAYEEAGLARRRILHRRVARAIRDAHRPRDGGRLAAVVAHHLREGGRDADAAVAYRRAGDHARRLFANADALEHYRSALALGHPEPATLHEAIGDLQTLRGEYGLALSAYEAAAALAQPGPHLAAVEHKIGGVHLRRGDPVTAGVHLDAAADNLPGDDGGARARVLADRSLAARSAGDTQTAERVAREALHLAEGAADTGALAQAHNILGVVARTAGDLDAARTHLEHSLRHAASLPDPSARVAALNNLTLVLADAGEHDAALEHARTALGVAAMQGDRHREAAIHNNMADVLQASGRTEDAMSHLKEAVRIFTEIGEAERPAPEIWKLVDW